MNVLLDYLADNPKDSNIVNVLLESEFLLPEEKNLLLFLKDVFDTTGSMPSSSLVAKKLGLFLEEGEALSESEVLYIWRNKFRVRAKMRAADYLQQASEAIIEGSDPQEFLNGAVSLLDNNHSDDLLDIDDTSSIVSKVSSSRSGKDGVCLGVEELDNIIVDFESGTCIIIAGFVGNFKSLSMSSVLYTPEGYKYMKDVEVGDLLIGSDGKSTRVLGVYPQGQKDIYEVEFLDGSKVRCSLDHLWSVYYRGYKLRTLSLGDIVEKGLYKEYMDKRDGVVRKSFLWSVPLVKPVEFGKKQLPIHPYILGLLLGDGVITSPQVKIMLGSVEDKEYISYIRKLVPTSTYYEVRGREEGYKDQAVLSECYVLHKGLSDLGLLGLTSSEKFIPEIYLYSSVDDRAQLLQGLLDSDGGVNSSGSFQFVSTSRKLNEGILALGRGLGFYGRHGEDYGSYYYDKLSGDRVECKEVSFVILSPSRKRKSIKSVTRVGVDYQQCLMVDSPDSLFLTDDYTLTHNTTMAMSCAVHNAIKGNSTAILTMETPPKILRVQLLSNFSFTPYWSGDPVPYLPMIKNTLPEEDLEKIPSLEDAFRSLPGQIDVFSPANIRGDLWTSLPLVCHQLAKKGVKILFIDHAQLLKYYSNTQDGISAVDRFVKKMTDVAVELDLKGYNFRVCFLSQINRDSYKKALRRSGSYDLTALAEYNELERSAAYIITMFSTDELKSVNEVRVQILKNRLGACLEEPISVFVDPAYAIVGGTQAVSSVDLGSSGITDLLGDEFGF